jgi:hypothetical protein
MAKKDQTEQTDLFYEPPKIAGLGITKFEIGEQPLKLWSRV